MNRPLIGILTFRNKYQFNEPGYFRDLIREGKGVGADVFLFSHHDLLPDGKQVQGFVPTSDGGWKKRLFPLPDVVIDRCRRWDQAFKEMRRKKLFLYANNKFTRKWKATELFAETQSLKKWIPKTVIYSPESLREMSREFPILYIKPGNGTGGMSVIRLVRKPNGYEVLARGRKQDLRKSRTGTEDEVFAWLDKWVRTQNIRSGNFMVQQGLNLQYYKDRIADVRVLIQKNAKGKWSVTGMGVRVGAQNSPTTNLLAKGGKALAFQPFMENRFGKEKAAQIHKECEALAHEVVRTIEQNFGPMLEYGLDVGVDLNGDVWLIEANPKPTRDLFHKLKQYDTYRTTLRRPIQYAMFLAKNNKRSV